MVFLNIKKLRPKITVSNVSESLFPLRLLNSLWGLSPIEMPNNLLWPKLSIFYNVGRFIIFALMFWVSFDFEYETFKERPIIMLVFDICTYAALASGLTCTFLHLFNHKKLKKFEQHIMMIDETLKIFGMTPSYFKELKKNLNLIFVWFLSGIIVTTMAILYLNILGGNSLYEAISICGARDLVIMLNTMIELNFAMKASTLSRRFKMLNALMQNASRISKEAINLNWKSVQYTFKSNIKSRSYFRNRNNLELLLRTTRQLHLNLCRYCRELNSIYGTQLSLQLSAAFIFFVGLSYNTFLMYRTKLSYIDDIINIVWSVSWMLFFLISIIYTVNEAVDVMKEAAETSRLAHEIYVPHRENKIADEVHELSLQILQNPLTFTVSGLIVFDHLYTREFIESIITYLILLVQYQSDVVKAANKLISNTGNTTTAIAT